MKIIKNKRQELVAEYVESNETATVKEIIERFNSKGISISRSTIHNDLKELGLTKGESRKVYTHLDTVQNAEHSETADDLTTTITFTFDKKYCEPCDEYTETYHDVSEFENKPIKNNINEPDEYAITYGFFYRSAMKNTEAATYNGKYGVKVEVSRNLEFKQENNENKSEIQVLRDRVTLLENFIMEEFAGEFETFEQKKKNNKTRL